MKLSKLLQIIKEEFQNYYSDWQVNDEPSMSDKYFEKITGAPASSSQQSTTQSEPQVDAEELVGYVNKIEGKILKQPVAIYKNPKNFNGIEPTVRGVLTNTLDLYVAQKFNIVHDDLLELLARKNYIPYDSQYNYDTEMPEQFIAVVRIHTLPAFVQSSAYQSIPIYYRTMFDEANQKTPYQFKILAIDK